MERARQEAGPSAVISHSISFSRLDQMQRFIAALQGYARTGNEVLPVKGPVQFPPLGYNIQPIRLKESDIRIAVIALGEEITGNRAYVD